MACREDDDRKAWTFFANQNGNYSHLRHSHLRGNDEREFIDGMSFHWELSSYPK
jgi:hypothetical protein